MQATNVLPTAVCLVLIGGSLVWGQTAVKPTSKDPDAKQEAAGFASRDPRYRIETTDVLDLSFRFTPEFNQTVAVQPDGFIPLQGVGDLKVAGLTVTEATDAIVKQYAKILNDPVVTIVLKEFTKPAFVVGGDVAKPGKYDLKGDTTLTDAIAIAGGFNYTAKESQVLLFRHVSKDTVETKKINARAILAKNKVQEDILLRPGDAIYVSRSPLGVVDRFMKATRLGVYFPLPIPR